eukprot:TRINITY_DN44195_c0_g1_i1.p1 TRINITY_DN44195_c0_g1~~TRINITY_DN44195_c0_g1_i1.p1  ORF type:complete len:463 (+),score=66.41 TRINITY_DN44195_c0_g1_i1:36-1424(+)
MDSVLAVTSTDVPVLAAAVKRHAEVPASALTLASTAEVAMAVDSAVAVTSTAVVAESAVAVNAETKVETGPTAITSPLVAWDAHLDNPSLNCTFAPEAMGQEVRASLGLVDECIDSFLEKCEFIGMGCYCAPSFALQLLGLRKNSYPFDWVRCSLNCILNCLDSKFEDFMAYSTIQVIGQYTVFGSTRWGGSFWHHNLEAPNTSVDMVRRIRRFYGLGEVAASTPRVFVRVANTSQEVNSILQLRNKLQETLPESQQIYFLLILEYQNERGPAVVSEPAAQNMFFYRFTEEDFRLVPAAGRHPLSVCGQRYALAIATAIKWWAGRYPPGEAVRGFSSMKDLASVCDQFDGGNAARELFAPRRFYGQQLQIFPDASQQTPCMQRLIACTQQQSFVLPVGVDVSVPWQVQCFGKFLQVKLPAFATPGLVVQLWLHNGQLVGALASCNAGESQCLGQIPVEERNT